MNHLLVDGDVLIYETSHSEQVVTRWERDLYTFHAFLEPAKAKIETFIENLKEILDGDEVTIVLSDIEANWRRPVLPEYKSRRATPAR